MPAVWRASISSCSSWPTRWTAASIRSTESFARSLAKTDERSCSGLALPPLIVEISSAARTVIQVGVGAGSSRGLGSAMRCRTPRTRPRCRTACTRSAGPTSGSHARTHPPRFAHGPDALAPQLFLFVCRSRCEVCWQVARGREAPHKGWFSPEAADPSVARERSRQGALSEGREGPRPSPGLSEPLHRSFGTGWTIRLPTNPGTGGASTMNSAG